MESGKGSPSRSKALEYDLPVIKSTRKLLPPEELMPLELMDNYGIYGYWMSLTPEEKRKQRRNFQKALEPRSLVYLNKISPDSIPDNIRSQFSPKDYDWEETDLVASLEKMHFVYEPRYWKSFQTHGFKYVGKRYLKPLFMGFISWNRVKSKKRMGDYFEQIENFLEDLDISEEDSIRAVDRLRGLVRERGAYINPRTGKAEPKISLWVFFTQDQNPREYTGGRFRALARDKPTPTPSPVEEVSSEEEEEDVRVLIGGPSPEHDEDIETIEKAVQESIRPGESPESVAMKRRIAIKRAFFEKSEENVFSLGKFWGPTKPKYTNSETPIIRLQGEMPARTRKRGEMIKGKVNAVLINLREVYDKNYLLPPLRRGVTVIASKEDLNAATTELQQRLG